MQRFHVVLLLQLLFSIRANSQQIAITFDDAPTSDSYLFTHADRAAKIRTQLKNFEVTAAFFVITGSIHEHNSEALKQYIADGHVIANHSHSHYSPSRVATTIYMSDIRKADSILQGWSGTIPFYRYPFLNEGQTSGKRDSIRNQLAALNLANGYVTVDNYDWYINGALQAALTKKKKVNYEKLKTLYLDHVYNSILFYDAIAVKTLGRSPKHVLLLHENDLAALFLTDLLTLLKQRGWTFISPQMAYSDPIASIIPDVLFNGQGRVGAIAFANGIPGKQLVQESEDEDYLKTLLDAQKVFE